MSDTQQLETMRPNPAFSASAYEDSVATWEALADRVVVKVWGGDWCVDCRQRLPDFGALLEAAGVDAVEQYPVERGDDGKVGPGVDEYGIELIPTVVVERRESGEELARFVEDAAIPIGVALAEDLGAHV
jgi:thiol-disulfide isomerase/thioredoxin